MTGLLHAANVRQRVSAGQCGTARHPAAVVVCLHWRGAIWGEGVRGCVDVWVGGGCEAAWMGGLGGCQAPHATSPHPPHPTPLPAPQDAPQEVARLDGKGSGYGSLLLQQGFTAERLSVWSHLWRTGICAPGPSRRPSPNCSEKIPMRVGPVSCAHVIQVGRRDAAHTWLAHRLPGNG